MTGSALKSLVFVLEALALRSDGCQHLVLVSGHALKRFAPEAVGKLLDAKVQRAHVHPTAHVHRLEH